MKAREWTSWGQGDKYRAERLVGRGCVAGGGQDHVVSSTGSEGEIRVRGGEKDREREMERV